MLKNRLIRWLPKICNTIIFTDIDSSVCLFIFKTVDLKISSLHVFFCDRTKFFLGLLSDEGLYELAKMIGAECTQLATYLRLPAAKQDQIRMDYPGNTLRQIFEILRIWRDSCKGTKEQVKGRLHEALQRCNRADLAEDLLQEVVEGSNEDVKYHSII